MQEIEGLPDVGQQQFATDINDDGWVIGNSDAGPYVWNAEAGLFDLNAGIVEGINNNGTVVGYTGTDVFLWDAESGKRDVGLPTNTKPTAIDDSGMIVGSLEGDKAFAWTSESGIVELDSGPHALRQSFARGVNDNGKIVGQFGNPSSDGQAFIWSEETGLQELATPSEFTRSDAVDINNHGQIIGTSWKFGIGNVAVMWDSDMEVQPLNDLIDPTRGYDLREPWAINDYGQIVVNGVNPDGKQHGFLVSPFPIGPIPGDTWPLDDRVNLDDLNAVRNSFGLQPCEGFCPGDTYPFDGAVDVNDLNRVRNNFGTSLPTATAVPEPAALVLLLLGLLSLAIANALPHAGQRWYNLSTRHACGPLPTSIG